MLPKSGGSPPATMNASDRRIEKRYRGKGSLRLSFDDPAHQEVNGRLVDYTVRSIDEQMYILVKLNVWRQFHRSPGFSHKAAPQTSNFRH